jgi:hypothetical protein
MIPRRQRLKVLVFKSIGSIHLNAEGELCYICGKNGHSGMAYITFSHQYERAEVKELVCLLCIGRTLKPPPDDMKQLRAIVRHQKNSDSLADLFDMVMSLSGRTHPVLGRVCELHESFQAIPPSLVSEAYSLANVYINDPDLWASYVWLRNNKGLAASDPSIVGALISFSGIGGNWPTHAERDVIRARRILRVSK